MTLPIFPSSFPFITQTRSPITTLIYLRFFCSSTFGARSLAVDTVPNRPFFSPTSLRGAKGPNFQSSLRRSRSCLTSSRVLRWDAIFSWKFIRHSLSPSLFAVAFAFRCACLLATAARLAIFCIFGVAAPMAENESSSLRTAWSLSCDFASADYVISHLLGIPAFSLSNPSGLSSFGIMI